MATYAQIFQTLLSSQRANGVTLAGGKAYFYAPGTENLATVYVDRDKSGPAENPYTLSANGQAEIFLDGLYDVKITDANDVQKYYWEDVNCIDVSDFAFDISDLLAYMAVGHVELTDERVADIYEVGSYLSLPAAIAAIGSNKATLRYSADIALADNLTIPANIELQPYNGAIITIASGKTLTINGHFPMVRFQAFAGDGTVILGGQNEACPEMFGENTTPGTTDITTAIQKAFDSLANVVFPANHDYMTSDTVTYVKGADGQGRDLTMVGSIKYTGTQDKAALIIGAIDDVFNRAELKIKVYRDVGDWTDEDHIGVHLYGLQNCDIHVERAEGFTVGVQMHGKGVGFAYNRGTLNYILSNKVGVLMVSEAPASGPSIGYANENVFYGGHISVNTNDNPTIDREGIRITTVGGHYPQNNSNRFIGASYELDFGTTGVATAINVEHGIENHFLLGRFESSGDPAVKVQNASRNNVFTSSYGNITVFDTSTSPSSHIMQSRDMVKSSLRASWDSGPLGRKLTKYDATTFMVAGIDIFASSGGTPAIQQTGFATNSTDYVETTDTRGLGVFFDSSASKQFLVMRSAVSGFGGRVVVKAYDSAGNPLTGTNPSYIQGVEGTTLPYTASWGGGYETGGDGEGTVFFTCHADVKKIAVIVTSGTAALKLKSFSVHATDATTDTALHGWVETSRPQDPWLRLATQAPDAGTYVVGTRVQRNPVAAGQPKGWYCTVAGAPGTWVSEGNL